MDKKVLVLSRIQFEKFYQTLTERQKVNMAFISIRNEEHPIIDNDSQNYLNLCFDDVEEQLPGEPVTLFDDLMADKIFHFTQNNLDKDLFIVHCLMGISRSGAVGDVLSSILEIPYDEFKRTNSQIKPNALVRSKLINRFFYS